MSPRSFITIVASPRPRMGKTLLARLLADFHRHNDRAVAAFDINGDDPALTQFLPAVTSRADVSDINGQMALFDRLVADDGVYKVVDLGYASFKPFFKVAKEIGFADEARRRGIATVVLFVVSPDDASIEAHAALKREFPGAAIVPAHNEVLGGPQHRDKFATLGPNSLLFRFPALAPGLRRHLDRRPFSFVDENAPPPRDLGLEGRNEMQKWLRRVFIEFREMELRVLLGDLQKSLKIVL